MALTLSNCGHDENNKYSGGAAGDQTGTEWYMKSIGSNWTYVFRHPTANVRKYIGVLAHQAADNNKVGYDQNQRTTFYTQLKSAGWYPSKITTKCEADCSAGVAAIVIATGNLLSVSKLKSVSKDMYTGNESSVLTSAGFTKSSFTSTSALKHGDILWRSGHTAIVVDESITLSSTTSSSSSSSSSTTSSSSTPSYTVGKTYTTKVDKLNVRTGAGTNYAKKNYASLTSDAKKHAYSTGQLKKGTSVTCKATKTVSGSVWMKIPSGWVCAYYKPDKKKYVG